MFEPLAKFSEILGLKGWRAAFLGVACVGFVAMSKTGYLSRLSDTFVLVVAAAGFASLSLGLASLAEFVSMVVLRLYLERTAAERTLKHAESIVADIDTFSDTERQIFGWLLFRSQWIFSAVISGDNASSLLGRGYILLNAGGEQIVNHEHRSEAHLAGGCCEARSVSLEC